MIAPRTARRTEITAIGRRQGKAAVCLSNEEKRVVRDYVDGITTGIRREDGESLASREANPTKVRVRGTGTRRGTHMRGDALEVRLYGPGTVMVHEWSRTRVEASDTEYE